jgi:HSP20 family protein
METEDMNLIPRRRGEVSRYTSNPFLTLSQNLPFDMQRLFDGVLGEAWNSSESGELAIQLDVQDTEDALLVRAEVPGVDKDDLTIELHDRTLTIRGEKRVEESRETDKQVYSERRYGSFLRTLTLPIDVDNDGVAASHSNGVLTVRLPKTTREQPKQIQISSN